MSTGRRPMRSIEVKELMVPLAEYATVSEDASLSQAVLALEAAQRNVEAGREKHRAVLVVDRGGRVVGELAQVDILRGLEPRYGELDKLTETSRFGFSPDFIKSMLDQYGLWRKPLDQVCKKASDIKVKTIMVTPGEGEYIEEEATLDEAVHRIVMGRHQSLLVRRGADIVGVLRLSDVFQKICGIVKACGLA